MSQTYSSVHPHALGELPVGSVVEIYGGVRWTKISLHTYCWRFVGESCRENYFKTNQGLSTQHLRIVPELELLAEASKSCST